MIHIGIDVGNKGGFSLIETNGEKMNIVTKSWNNDEFVNFLFQLEKTRRIFCVIEEVHAFKGQGVTSMFNFGKSYGFILGVLEAYQIPYQVISPQKWKKEFGLIKKDKKESIKVCKRLFPNVCLLANERCRIESDGMAESLLIAEYARRIYKIK